MFYSLGQIFRSRAMTKSVKIRIYKTTVKTSAAYGSKAWPVNKMDVKRLNTWDRIIYIKEHVTVLEQGMWRI